MQNTLANSIVFIMLILTEIAVAAENPEAEESLATESLLTSENKFTLTLSSTYINSESTGTIPGESVLIQANENQFISVLTNIKNKFANRDTLILTPSLRYGATKNTQISIYSSVSANQERFTNESEFNSESSFQYLSTGLNISYRLRKENKSPGIFIFSGITLAENIAPYGSQEFVFGKSFSTGAAIFRTLDPIIISVSSIYQYNMERKLNGVSIEPGDYISLSPSINFLPNNDSSISLGFDWIASEGYKLNDIKVSNFRTQSSLRFGFAYSISKRTNWFFNTSSKISGIPYANFSASLSYKLN